MRHRYDCPGRAGHAVFDERDAREWACHHQLQLVAVAETVDHRAEALAAYEKAMCAAACLKVAA